MNPSKNSYYSTVGRVDFFSFCLNISLFEWKTAFQYFLWFMSQGLSFNWLLRHSVFVFSIHTWLYLLRNSWYENKAYKTRNTLTTRTHDIRQFQYTHINYRYSNYNKSLTCTRNMVCLNTAELEHYEHKYSEFTVKANFA